MVGYQQPKGIKTYRLFYCLLITNHGGLILTGMFYCEQLLIRGVHKSQKIIDSLVSGLELIIEQLRIKTENVTAFFVARHFTVMGGVVEFCEMG